MQFMQEDLERHVVSGALQGVQDIKDFVSLPEELWTKPLHKIIHQSIRELQAEGGKSDTVAVYEKMNSSGHSIELDELFALERDYVLIPSQYETICQRLRSQFDQRMVISAIHEAAFIAESAPSAQEAKQSAIGRLLDLQDYGPAQCIFGGTETLRDVLDSTKEAFERPDSEKQKPVGVTTGFQKLDMILRGFRKGGLYILGAGTGRGKSVMAMNIACAAAQSGKKVLYCSLEMSHQAIMRRILSSYARISGDLIETGSLTSDQLDRLVDAVGMVKKIADNITILNQRGVSLYQLGAIIRQVSQKPGIDLIIVDYLQLLEVDQTYSREREVASISKALVMLAGVNDVPILALSQLNETGQIRESRAVGQDASAVIRIDYPSEVNERWDEQPDDINATIRVLKHRHGPTGNVDVLFSRAYQQFTELRNGY